MNITPELIKDYLPVLYYAFAFLGGKMSDKFGKWLTDLKYTKKHKDQFDLEVFMKLTELRNEMESSRACIFLRHNGINLKNGKGLDKVSMVYEVCDPSTKSTKEDSQNIPIHLYNGILVDCDVNNKVIIETDKLEEGYLKRNLSVKGVEIKVMIPFRKNKNDIPEGYVAVDFIDDDVIISDEMLAIIEKYTNEIGYLLRN